jgi:hypothetical protein
MRYLILFMLLIFFVSCVYDKHSKIITVKNDSDIDLVVIWGGKFIDDEQLFYRSKYSANKKSITEIIGPDGLDSLGGRTFYFFRKDSVYSKINRGEVSGIVKKTLLYEYRISHDSIGLKKIINFPLSL